MDNKSEIGVAHVALDLMKQGFVVCYPMSEHAPFDLVAVRDSCRYTVQVKFRRANKHGALSVSKNNSWSNTKGSRRKLHSVQHIDTYAVTDGQVVAYIPFVEVANMTGGFCVRIDAAKNNQKKKTRIVEDYKLLGL